MTATLSIAAQIAQDIREAIKPDFVPASIDRRLEAIIDVNLAGERAKVAELTNALETAETALLVERQQASEQDNRTKYGYAGDQSFPLNRACVERTEPALAGIRAALFNLQA